MVRVLALFSISLFIACGGDSPRDGGVARDLGVTAPDLGFVDAEAQPDALVADLGVVDSGEHPDALVSPDAEPEDAAAPDAEPTDATFPDAESKDAVGFDAEPQDAVGFDAEPQDAAAPDATPDSGPPDTGPLDTGPLDTGVPADGGAPVGCVDGDEGCTCAFGSVCNDPGLRCYNASGPNVPPNQRVNICIRDCANDLTCISASTVGNNLCRPAIGTDTICVSAERTEGQIIDLSRIRNTPMTGCPSTLFALNSNQVGLGALADDQASCGRPCAPGAPQGSPTGCTATYPYCNPDVFTSALTPGLCSLRPLRHGDFCSRSSAVGLCDSDPAAGTAGQGLICVGVPFDLVMPGDPSPSPEAGICVLTCSLLTPNCAPANDPGVGPAQCRQINAVNTTTGFCSNQCSPYPSRCTTPTALGQGSTCTDDLFFEAAYPFSFCRSVAPPVIPEWTPSQTPTERCLNVPGGEGRCQAGTYCLNDGLGGVCGRLCDASNAAASGCQMSTAGNPRCDDTIIGSAFDGFGLCLP